MIASIIQHYTYHYNISLGAPVVITVVLAFVGLLFFMVAIEYGGWEPFFIALVIWSFIAIPATQMNWHAHKTETRTRMQVVDPTNGQKIWLRATKQLDGSWWPVGGRSAGK